MTKQLNTPFNVLRNREWDSHPKAQVVGAYILNTIGATALATSTFASIVVGTLAISAVTSFLLKALAPKPDFGRAQGLLANTRSATAPQEIVYGEVRKGGIVTFMESTGSNNEYLHQIICLAGHEVTTIDVIYINDQIANFDTTSGQEAFVLTSGSGADQVNWNSKIRIYKYFGTDTQTADPNLVSETSVTSDFKGQGISYLYVRMHYDQDVFAEGIPLFTAKIKGRKVVDNRISSSARNYSANASVIVSDFLTSDFGLNNSGTINTTMFDVAANACDENVTLDGGGTEKRYEINGVISLDRTPSDILGDMMTACAGTLFWGQGKWQLKAGVYTSSVKNFTLDDFRSSISLNTKRSRRDNFNIVQGTFNDANQDYIAANYPEIRSSTFISNDANVESSLDLALPFTTSSSMAQRLAKLTLYRAREQMTLSADFSLEALDVQVGDNISLTNSRYGWSQKEFEVVGWKFKNDDNDGDLRVTLDLAETSSSAFNWNAEEAAIDSNDSTLPNPRSGLTVTGLTSSAFQNIEPDGTSTVFSNVSWTAGSSPYVDYFEVQWKTNSSSQYSSTVTNNTTINVGPLIGNTSYTVRVRAVTSIGIKGSFVTHSFNSGVDASAPSAPTNVSTDSGFKQITVNWTNSADLDLKEVEVYANTSTSTPGAAGLIGVTSGSSFVHAGLAQSTTRYYFLKSVDFTGNKSGFTAVSVGSSLADPTDGQAGSRYATARYYQESTTQPSTTNLTSNVTYNWLNGQIATAYQNWSSTAPTVAAVTASNFWYVDVVFVDTTGAASSSTGSSVTTPSRLFNFNGLVTFTNTSGTTTLNNALADSSTVIDGGRITTGQVSTSRLLLDNVMFDTDGSGNLIIKTDGVNTTQLATGSITQSSTSATGAASLTAGQDTSVTVNLTGVTSGSLIMVTFNYIVSSTSANDQYSIDMVRSPTGSSDGAISNVPISYVGTTTPSTYTLRTGGSAGSMTVGAKITAKASNSGTLVVAIASLFAQEFKR